MGADRIQGLNRDDHSNAEPHSPIESPMKSTSSTLTTYHEPDPRRSGRPTCNCRLLRRHACADRNDLFLDKRRFSYRLSRLHLFLYGPLISGLKYKSAVGLEGRQATDYDRCPANRSSSTACRRYRRSRKARLTGRRSSGIAFLLDGVGWIGHRRRHVVPRPGFHCRFCGRTRAQWRKRPHRPWITRCLATCSPPRLPAHALRQRLWSDTRDLFCKRGCRMGWERCPSSLGTRACVTRKALSCTSSA